MEALAKHDIQGIIIRGYSHLPAAAFILIGINDATNARQWLSGLISFITPGDQKPADAALHIAFTFSGLKALGLDAATLDTFPMELEDGMTTAHKQLFLGDYAGSDPQNWDWGGKQNEEVHAVLMFYAVDETTLSNKLANHLAQLKGVHEIKQLDTTVLYERKEHFGFHDGISQPTINGLSRDDDAENIIAPGEFLLGYKNEYDQYTTTPVVSDATASKSLPQAVSMPGTYDLGANGSYMVFRQLAQDVPLFWTFMDGETRDANGNCDGAAMIKLASKMVGRWPGGASLILSPDKDDPAFQNNSKFDYRHSDAEGLKCPFAAHVRRSNPRDALDTDRLTSIKIAKKHRILRRGRSYGKPLTEDMNPEECLNVKDDTTPRGLHFICFNSDIARQFEFIQNAWMNNPKFSGMYEERDPISGNHHQPDNAKMTGTFTAPNADGLRTQLTNLPEFVTVKGGAYFFMPGIAALHYLATF